jgi:hypothetical protein
VNAAVVEGAHPGRGGESRHDHGAPVPVRALALHPSNMPALADALSATLTRVWPARRHQERLLDLGERKGWTEADRDAAVVRLAGWLAGEVLLPSCVGVVASPRAVELTDLPDLPVYGATPVVGVGLRTVALAHLVGTEPKTLANSLARGLRPDRRDHRWLLFLSRLARADADPDALVFHRRSPAAVAAELARTAVRSAPDAGDAMLLLSLVSLWQRRRPTSEARAARTATVSRRLVPKPAVAMKWDIIALTQLHPLIELAVDSGGAFGRVLAAVVVDAALTEAHLAPHRARARGDADPDWGDLWLRRVQAVVADPRVVELLGADEAAVFRWRIARMRAYASGSADRPSAPPPHPYVNLACAIDSARAGTPAERCFTAHLPGYFMLVPQARGLRLIEGA